MYVLLVDDHGIVREGTALLLKSIDPSIEVAHARTAAECLAQVTAARFDLVLLDLELPDRSGIEVLIELKRDYPEVPVVVLSAHEDRDSVLESIKCGAMGFIPKSAENPQLLGHALKLAVSGAVTVPASMFNTSVGGPRQAPSQSPIRQVSSEDLAITPRQLDALRLVVQGLPNKLIARHLDIAETTARRRVSELLAAFGVANRTQLVVEVARRGLVLGGIGR
jgi:DNA-binding NarL/FixJ family response regulator